MQRADEDTDQLGKVLWRYATRVLPLCVAFFFVLQQDNLTTIFFREQDFAVLAAGLGLLLAISVGWGRLPLKLPRQVPPAWLFSLFVLVFTGVGTWLVFGNYALSRDELLADFDADFLRQGLAVAPVPVEWRPFASAMMPIFMLPVPVEMGWLSSYLPGNAALRALFDITLDRSWTNPVLAAVACLALWRVARRLWPGHGRLALLPILLTAASPQLLTMAMTPYAMTGHLAFNMIWLACFLRGDRRGDIGALGAGFVATGLHQIVFHPLFAAPFILELLLARRWRRAALYILAYAAIGLFWASYWQLVLPAGGVAAAALDGAQQQGVQRLLSQIAELVTAFSVVGPVVMALNLLRFAAWNHLLLLPLAFLAWPLIRRGEGIARPLALGIVLMLTLLLVLLPWQGHGWGYRYLHGFLGSFAILAGYGWTRIGPLHRERRNAVLALTTAATVFLVLPFHLWNAHAFVRPYRNAFAFLQRADADVVIVDAAGTLFAQDLVRNRPDLSNRPLILDLAYLDEQQLRALCQRSRPRLFDRRHALANGIRLVEEAPISEQRRLLDALTCARPLPLP